MPIEGVIIAAGKSSRMGSQHKLTMDLKGKTVIERSIGSMRPFCTRIIVVTGFHADKIRKQTESSQDIVLVHNADCEAGMFSSLKLGLRQAKGERTFFLPGDCPFAAAEVYEAMLHTEGDIVVPAYQGHPGHPILFSRRAVSELLEDAQCHTLKEFIDGKGPTIVAVDCPGILWDIDTPEDYAQAQKYIEVRG